MRWIKDQKIEAKLRSLHIQFEIETGIPWSKIDLTEGLRHQARMTGYLDQNAVLVMAMDMGKEDAAFPMPIFQKPPRGNYWPWGGNHRLASFALAFPNPQAVDGYVVSVRDAVMLDLLSGLLNSVESPLGYSRDERVFQVRRAHEQHGIAVSEACAMYGAKPEWVYKVNAQERVREITANIVGIDKLSNTSLERLNVLADNESIVRSIARMIVAHEVKSTELSHLIADVRKQRNENAMMGEIDRWQRIFELREAPRKRESKDGKGSIQFTKAYRDALLRSLTTLDKVLEKADTIAKLQLTDPTDLARVKELGTRAFTRLNRALSSESKGKEAQS